MNDTREECLRTLTRSGPIAYLTGQYPLVSHTFIQREVAALRAQGTTVLTCAVRRMPERIVGAAQKAEADRTFYVLTAAKAPHRLLGAHLAMIGRRPGAWTRMLGLALRTAPPGLRGLLFQLIYFVEAGVLAAHLRRQGVGHLHNHFGDSSCTVAMLAAGMAGIPFSYTEHGPTIFFAPKYWRLDAKIARAHFLVAISHFCRAQLMLFCDERHWDKLAIVHCGVDSARYGDETRAAAGKRMLFVGRLAAVKGVPMLLEALARLRVRHPEAQLTLLGDGPERPALAAQAARVGLKSVVEFAGYADEAGVIDHLGRADLFVLPSFAEGVPVVLMEAMAAQVPVVASHVAGVPELVVDGESGFLVPPGDVATLTDRIDTLLADPERRRSMGAAGRKKVMAEFDSAHEAKKLRALFGRCAERLQEGDEHE